jgi:hypothetical protein
MAMAMAANQQRGVSCGANGQYHQRKYHNALKERKAENESRNESENENININGENENRRNGIEANHRKWWVNNQRNSGMKLISIISENGVMAKWPALIAYQRNNGNISENTIIGVISMAAKTNEM